MITIHQAKTRIFNEETETFHYFPEINIKLEHSLVALSKWESKWKTPFLAKNAKHTEEKFLDYFRCMTITQNVPDETFNYLSAENKLKIRDYIDDPHTATWFSEESNSKKNNEQIITSEVIYSYMVAFRIDKEYEKWHLNRLLTLIRVCGENNKEPKKLSKTELAQRNHRLNAERKKKLKKSR